ncbi:hypothetical protein [uncultured Zobellia sp.]|uniref:hypothetical protein n=1 Tax=uncultured Zobellia sp. TaxID=255433 RepID=UPI0025928EF9|nr:hypothetical protein [uncultured Zobellia sp.]
MKKVLMLFLMSTVTALVQSQEDGPAKKGEFNLTASVHNQWYWRGYAVGPDPIIAAQASYSYGGLEIGTWNGYGLAGIWKDTDVYVSYTTKFGLSFAFWDIFNYSDYTASDGYEAYGNHSQANYFNYLGEGTRHFFDLSVGYTIPKTNLNIFLATLVAGRDRNPDNSNRYSTYIKASYNFTAGKDISVMPYVSYGFALNSDNGGTFWQWTDKAVANANSSGINEIGVSIAKAIHITEKYKVKASAGLVASPINYSTTGLFGITLF